MKAESSVTHLLFSLEVLPMDITLQTQSISMQMCRGSVVQLAGGWRQSCISLRSALERDKCGGVFLVLLRRVVISLASWTGWKRTHEVLDSALFEEWVCIIYGIWLARNQFVFQHESIEPSRVVENQMRDLICFRRIQIFDGVSMGSELKQVG